MTDQAAPGAYTVNASGATGVAIGDHAQVVQHIAAVYNIHPAAAGQPRLAPKLRVRADKLLARHRLFGGREEELEALDHFVAEEAGGYLFVTGPSGYGKTALLANWIQRAAAQPWVAQPSAAQPSVGTVCYHFINRAEGMAGEDDTLRDLCQQLTANHDMSGELPVSTGELRALYGLLLAIPPVAGRGLVVVLDGLDERDGWAPGLHQLFPNQLPDGVHLIFSARELPGTDWLELLELPPAQVRVVRLERMGRQEIASLLQAAGEPAATWAEDTGDGGAVATIHAKSRGDPFYLRFLLADIQNGRIGTPQELENQPSGLQGYLDAWWRELSATASEPAVRDLLGYLLVAKGPLTRDDLLAINDTDALDSWVFETTLARVARFLIGDDQAGYTLSHSRFQEYVAGHKISPADQRPYRQQLLAYCAAWQEHPTPYALGQYAQHLADEAGSGSPQEQHERINRLVKLVADREFQQAYLATLKKPVAMQRDLDRTVHIAAADAHPDAVPLVVQAALQAVAFRQERLSPEEVFAAAAAGDVSTSREHLGLFPSELEWQQASSLLIAWLAASTNRAVARQLYDEVQPRLSSGGSVALQELADRVHTVLEDNPWPTGSLPEPSRQEVRAIITRMAGLKDELGLPMEQAYEALTETRPTESSYHASVRMTLDESYLLVAYAAHHPSEPQDYVQDHLAILGANSYVRYRNRFLWPLLGSVLLHPDPQWARDYAVRVAQAALATNKLEFREGLPLMVLAWQIRSSVPEAWDELERYREAAEGIATLLTPDTGRGDSWGSYTRRLASLAQVYSLLDDPATMDRLLGRARGLQFGFAGFQAPAWWCLAETMRICDSPGFDIRSVLDAAKGSAHNIQEPTFCAQTTARHNALAERWWGPPATGIDLQDVVRELATEPEAPRFCALHRVGEDYSYRNSQTDLPYWARSADTLRQIAELYGRPLPTLQRLNPPGIPDQALPTGTWVRIPDLEFAPLLAARLSAEILVRPDLPPPERVHLMQGLVPVAAANPTALDTVLARLLLAMPSPGSELLETLADLVQDLPLQPVEGAHGMVEGY